MNKLSSHHQKNYLYQIIIGYRIYLSVLKISVKTSITGLDKPGFYAIPQTLMKNGRRHDAMRFIFDFGREAVIYLFVADMVLIANS